MVGDRPLVKLGGDLIAITADGYIPLLQFLSSGREQRQLAVSDTIAPTVSELIRLHSARSGWQSVLFSDANWLLFNVPTGPDSYVQHIMNVQTGAWCRFRGWKSHCYEMHANRLFFGGDAGKVNEANTGSTDLGMTITADASTAYNYLDSPYDKIFHMIRAHVESGGGVQVSVGATVDFDRKFPSLATGQVTTVGTKWDTKKWDTFKWGGGEGRLRVWQGVELNGSAISAHLQVTTRGDQVEWQSTDVLYDQVT